MLKRKSDYTALWNAYGPYFPPEFLENILYGTGRNGMLLTRDYVRALRLLALLRNTAGADAHFGLLRTADDALKLLHPCVRFRHRFDSVNLAARYDELKPEAQKELFESSNWLASTKIDGFRVWICAWNRPEAAPGVFMFSRNYSDVDCSLNDYWDHVLQTITIPTDTFLALDCECVFDGDIQVARECGIIAEAKLGVITSLMQMDVDESLEVQRRYLERTGTHMVSFALIHPLYMSGRNYTKRTLGEGMQVYDKAVTVAKSMGFNIYGIERTDGPAEQKRAMLNRILSSGGEGLVFHNKLGHYTASENRDKTSWVKLKRTVSESAQHDGIGDTIDAYVTGFKLGTPDTNREGLVSALEFSILMLEADGLKHEHHLATVSGLPAEFLKKCTVIADGKPTLNPQIYGKVGELDGQCLSSRNLRLKHPRLIDWRFDKLPTDCVLTREWLESQVL